MRYILKSDARKCPKLETVGNIDVTGSVRGMQNKFGWPKGGQVRCGGYIYNVGPAEVERLRGIKILKGE